MSLFFRSKSPDLSRSIFALGSALATAGLTLFAMAAPLKAQTSMEELRAHPEYTASNYLVYPEPDKNVKYTKAPKGYKPFYISHYGRHGSRYHYSADDYNYLYETLQKADSAKALTLDGKKILVASQILALKAAPRAGDLTQVGAAQHQGIAKRMARNFPELFKSRKIKGKKLRPHVDAYASTSGRCIVSMSAFVAGLSGAAPEVDIRLESGKDLMGFICTYDWNDMEYTRAKAYTDESDKLWAAINPKPLMKKLFSDSAYVAANIDVNNFYNRLFEIASSMQGMDAPLKEVISANLCDIRTGKCDNLFDSLFTVEESITRWKAQNAWWYSLQGTSPLQQTTKGIDYAKGTLRHIIREASYAINQNLIIDAINQAKASDVKLFSSSKKDGSFISATLRFGHDAGLLPLAGLMQLSVANAKVSDLSKLHEEWNDFRVIPMAANLQIVFYKKPGRSSPAKKATDAKSSKNDILVKFLYNEREVTAPIPCEENCPAAPYYRWDDVKDFYKGI